MTIQRIVFSIAYTYYLGTGRLITKEQVADVLAGMLRVAISSFRITHSLTRFSFSYSVPQSENHRFKLATEEYLHALVSLVNELSRLAVNSVTLGDFGTPVRLSAFVKDLHTGFQMLNLKNDSLRKRFDSIKVSKIVIQKKIRKVKRYKNKSLSNPILLPLFFYSRNPVRCEKDRRGGIRYLLAWLGRIRTSKRCRHRS